MRPSLHTRQLNGPFEDPGLYMKLLWEGRALMFDLGHTDSLSSRDILKITDIAAGTSSSRRVSGFPADAGTFGSHWFDSAGSLYVAANRTEEVFRIDDLSNPVGLYVGRGIYNGVKAGDITLPLEYDDDEFDGVISSGTFTHGHVGSEPLIEIFRIIKPNGILACTVHEELWQNRKFDQVFQSLEDQNLIRCLSLKFDRYFKNDEPAGWFCVYQKV